MVFFLSWKSNILGWRQCVIFLLFHINPREISRVCCFLRCFLLREWASKQASEPATQVFDRRIAAITAFNNLLIVCISLSSFHYAHNNNKLVVFTIRLNGTLTIHLYKDKIQWKTNTWVTILLHSYLLEVLQSNGVHSANKRASE